MARVPLLTGAGRFLDVSEQPCHADFILVLGGGYERPAVAAALYKAGLARQVLVPEFRITREIEAGLALPENEVVKRVLRARGVPDEAIVLLPGAVGSTSDEVALLVRFLEDHPGSTVTVVTSAYHTRRARLLFRRTNLQAASLHFVAAPVGGCDASNWWRSERSCMGYLREFIKLAAYSLDR